MGFFTGIKEFFFSNDVNEELKQFKNIGSEPNRKDSEFGEGYENPLLASAGLIAHQFYDKYLYQKLDTKIKKLEEYRRIAGNAEISDVIEDAVIESTMPNDQDEIFKLVFRDEKLEKNKNATKNIQNEFNELVYNRLRLNTKIQNYMEDYFVDGELYFENVIDTNNSKKGILYWKKLPTETMDFIYNYEKCMTEAYIQYLKGGLTSTMIRSIEDARNSKDIILFDKAQIAYMNYGKFSPVDKTKVFGYLEKARKPFNQLNMLETSVIIYRLVRAPERFVFNIDVGNMPRDKAMQFVEKMKQKLSTKESFDPETGLLKKATNVMSISENFFLPTSSCIVLDTKIDLMDGRTLSLENIIEEHNDGKKNYVYSVDQKTGKIIPGEIEWAGVTRKNTEIVRVYLDSEDYIDCTPDHKFVLRDGTEKEAQFLLSGDSLMPLYKRKMNVKTNKLDDKNGYEQIFDLETNNWVYTHRTQFTDEERKGNVVHHKDFNKLNNNPDNLELMEFYEHWMYHSCVINEMLWARPEHRKFMSEFKTQWWEENEDYKDVLSKQKTDWWEDHPEKREEFSISMTNKWKDPDFVEAGMAWLTSPKSDEYKNNIRDGVTRYFQTDTGKQQAKNHSEKERERWKNMSKEEREEYALIRSKSSAKFWNSEDGNMAKKQMAKKIAYILTKEMFDIFIDIFVNNKELNYLELTKLLKDDIRFWSDYFEKNSKRPGFKNNHLSKHVIRRLINNFTEYKTFSEFKNNFKYNHKVIRVEKLNYKLDTGCLTIKDPGENHNFGLSIGVFIKNSGRASSVTTVGGNPSGFAELDDIYYFQKKLYKALKYPISRVQNAKEGRSGESLFGGGSNFGEIPRDEVKWSVFLENQQDKFCRMLLKTFLIHLEFKGFLKQYGLDEYSLAITMNCPNSYRDQIEQKGRETRFNNYNMLVSNTEFSKSYLMKKYLDMDDDEIKLNAEGLKLDKELFGNANEEDI